jgi:hypothetical protein
MLLCRVCSATFISGFASTTEVTKPERSE